MGCTSTKLKSKKDLCFINVPLQSERKMNKEEGITTRESKISSTRINQVKQQIVNEVSLQSERQIISNIFIQDVPSNQ